MLNLKKPNKAQNQEAVMEFKTFFQRGPRIGRKIGFSIPQDFLGYLLLTLAHCTYSLQKMLLS